jgi:hypothetical protein
MIAPTNSKCVAEVSHKFFQLKTELYSILDLQFKQMAITRLEEYQNHVLQFGNKSWHGCPSDAVTEIQCSAIDGIGLPKWKCV